jgi:hypothetical protein
MLRVRLKDSHCWMPLARFVWDALRKCWCTFSDLFLVVGHNRVVEHTSGISTVFFEMVVNHHEHLVMAAAYERSGRSGEPGTSEQQVSCTVVLPLA